MAFDVRKYWRARRDLEATLPEVNYITSIGNEVTGAVGGRVFLADREVTARGLVEQTHRISTAEEVERFHQEMAERDAVCRAMTQAAAGKQVLTVDPALAERIRVK
jgi:hypothetical protein